MDNRSTIKKNTTEVKMDFPLLRSFKVEWEVTRFLKRKYREYQEQEKKLNPADNEVYISDSGIFTDNLVEWEDEEYQAFLKNNLLPNISQQLKISPDRIDIFYNHIFDYKEGGHALPHTHQHVEDFVSIIYLTDVKEGGRTIFYLNDGKDCKNSEERKEFRERTIVKFVASERHGVIFSSMLEHEAELTTERKLVFVVGIKVKTWIVED